MMKYILLITCATTLLCSCQSTLTQEEILIIKKERQQAVIDSARELAEQQAKDLPEDKLSYIRYTTPHIYTSSVLSGKVVFNEIPTHDNGWDEITESFKSRDLKQILVTWNPPEEDKPVTVMGTAHPDLSFWQPVRLVREDFFESEAIRESAERQARNYAMQTMSYLTIDQEKLVRFGNPYIMDTSFDIDFKETKPYADMDRKQKYYFDQQKLEQTSFIWPVDSKSVVITGFWNKGKNNKAARLTNWTPVESRLLVPTEIKAQKAK